MAEFRPNLELEMALREGTDFDERHLGGHNGERRYLLNALTAARADADQFRAERDRLIDECASPATTTPDAEPVDDDDEDDGECDRLRSVPGFVVLECPTCGGIVAAWDHNDAGEAFDEIKNALDTGVSVRLLQEPGRLRPHAVDCPLRVKADDYKRGDHSEEYEELQRRYYQKRGEMEAALYEELSQLLTAANIPDHDGDSAVTLGLKERVRTLCDRLACGQANYANLYALRITQPEAQLARASQRILDLEAQLSAQTTRAEEAERLHHSMQQLAKGHERCASYEHTRTVWLEHERDTALGRAEKAEQQTAALLVVVQKLEWCGINDGGFGYCKVCFNEHAQDHKPDCALKAALSAPAAAPPAPRERAAVEEQVGDCVVCGHPSFVSVWVHQGCIERALTGPAAPRAGSGAGE